MNDDRAGEQPTSLESDPLAITNGRIILAAGLFLLALVVRAAAARWILFPLDPDDAYYAAVARRLAAGHGFTVDCIWHYLSGVPDSFPVPSSSYWGPLVPAVLWGSFAVFGESWRAAQMPSALFGAGLVVFTYFFVLREAKNATFALLAAAAVILSVTMVHSSSSPGTAIFYAALLCAILALTKRFIFGNAGIALATGALAGLLSLARNDGVLVLFTLALVCFVFRRGQSRAAWRQVAVLTAGFLVVRLPWELYNALALGAGFGGGQYRAAFLLNYSELFTVQADKLTLGHMLQAGPKRLLAIRASAFGNNLWEAAVQVGVVPFVIALLGLVARRKQPTMAAILVHYLVLFLFSALVFPFPTEQGTFGHSFTGMVPLVWGAAFIALHDWGGARDSLRWRKVTAWGLALVILAATANALVPAFRRVDETSAKRGRLETFIVASLSYQGWQGQPVLHFDAWDYYYSTMKPALMMPRDEYPDIVGLAKRFNAPFLVANRVLQGYHPDFVEAWRNDPYIVLVDEPVFPVQVFKFLYPECSGRHFSRLDLAREHSRAGMALDNANLAAAQWELRKAVALAPEIPDTHYNLALVLEGLATQDEERGRIEQARTKTEEALSEARQAVRLAPDRPQFLEFLRHLERVPSTGPSAGQSSQGSGEPRG